MCFKHISITYNKEGLHCVYLALDFSGHVGNAPSECVSVQGEEGGKEFH